MTRSNTQCVSRGFEQEATAKALRQIVARAATTAAELHKQMETNPPTCHHCGAPIEDLWHQWWECLTCDPIGSRFPKVMARGHGPHKLEHSFGLTPPDPDLQVPVCRSKVRARTAVPNAGQVKEPTDLVNAHTTLTDGTVHRNSTPWSMATIGIVADFEGKTDGYAPQDRFKALTERN